MQNLTMFITMIDINEPLCPVNDTKPIKEQYNYYLIIC